MWNFVETINRRANRNSAWLLRRESPFPVAIGPFIATCDPVALPENRLGAGSAHPLAAAVGGWFVSLCIRHPATALAVVDDQVIGLHRIRHRCTAWISCIIFTPAKGATQKKPQPCDVRTAGAFVARQTTRRE